MYYWIEKRNFIGSNITRHYNKRTKGEFIFNLNQFYK